MCLTLYYKALRVTFLKELCVVVVVQQSSTDFTHFSGKFFDAEKCILILLVSKFSLLRNVQKMHFKHVVVVGRLVAKVIIKLKRHLAEIFTFEHRRSSNQFRLYNSCIFIIFSSKFVVCFDLVIEIFDMTLNDTQISVKSCQTD